MKGTLKRKMNKPGSTRIPYAKRTRDRNIAIIQAHADAIIQDYDRWARLDIGLSCAEILAGLRAFGVRISGPKAVFDALGKDGLHLPVRVVHGITYYRLTLANSAARYVTTARRIAELRDKESVEAKSPERERMRAQRLAQLTAKFAKLDAPAPEDFIPLRPAMPKPSEEGDALSGSL